MLYLYQKLGLAILLNKNSLVFSQYHQSTCKFHFHQ